MLKGPWMRICRIKSIEKHPLSILTSSSSSSQPTIDFWGPCAVMSTYVAILWLGRVRDGPWAYVIWSFAAIFHHFIMRASSKSTLLMHMALLGYSIAPIIPFALIIVLFHPPVWLATVLEVLAVVWSSSSAILTYISISIISQESKHRLSLLFPSVLLTEMYFIALLPIRFYSYHKHAANPAVETVVNAAIVAGGSHHP